jgi:hypothetical protein
MKEQTPVQWLLEQLEKYYNAENESFYSDLIKEAKEREKEVIILAYHEGYSSAIFTEFREYNPEQYYNENFSNCVK